MSRLETLCEKVGRQGISLHFVNSILQIFGCVLKVLESREMVISIESHVML